MAPGSDAKKKVRRSSGQKPAKGPKTDLLPTAKSDKLGGPLPFLPQPVKPPEVPGAEKTAQFQIPSAAFFVDTRSALEQAGPLPPPPAPPEEQVTPFPVTDRVAGEDTRRYRRKVKESTDRMRKPLIPAYREEGDAAPAPPAPPPPAGGTPAADAAPAAPATKHPTPPLIPAVGVDPFDLIDPPPMTKRRRR